MTVFAPVAEVVPVQPVKRWTRVAFRQLPEGPPYYELENGELIEMARPRGRHQKLIGKLYALISAHVESEKLGEIWPEVEVDLTDRHTYVPDLSFLFTENLHRFADDIAIDGPPDLVIEIGSPSTMTRDLSTKSRTYQRVGVPWYWFIHGENLMIQEYKNSPDGFIYTQAAGMGEPFSPEIFPGLTFNLAELLGETVE
jgi:Uma2 family endonuclease